MNSTRVKVCSNCNKEVSMAAKNGDKCPYCNVRWGGESSSGYRYSGRGIGKLIGLGIAVLVGLAGLVAKAFAK